MNEPKTQQEPSMEEILASIRRIISEDTQGDGDAASKGGAPKDANGAASDADDDEVLELTEVVEDAPDDRVDDPAPAMPPAVPVAAEPVAMAPPPAEEPLAASQDEAPSADTADSELFAASQPAEEADAAAEAAMAERAAETPAPQAAGGTSVISEHAADAAMRAFGSLASALQGPGDGTGVPLGEGNRTIEDIVRDLLRPMLREWLDANLPDMVQRIVLKEIRELVRRAEDV